MKIRSGIYLAGLLSGLLALPAMLPRAASAADSGGTMDSMKQGASNAAGAVKNGAEDAAGAVKSGATKAYDGVKSTVSGNSSDKTNLSEPDRTFVQKAAVAGMFEVESAKVAKDKATSPDLKEFADKMITDHTKANDDLMAIAKQKNVDVPSSLDAEHQAKLDALSKLSGAAFDRTYKQQQTAGHDKVLALMTKEAKTGQDADLKAFAQKYDSVIAEHDHMVKKTKVGGAASSKTHTGT